MYSLRVLHAFVFKDLSQCLEMAIHRQTDKLSSVIAPMLTPCLADGSLDLDGARAMVDYLAETGRVRSIFARSGMGRMFTFTVAETKSLGRAVREAAGDRVGFLLGCGGEWLERDTGGHPDPNVYLNQAIELTRFAEDLGADAAVHVIPEAIVPDRLTAGEVVLRYYEAVHDATGIPIVMYQPRSTNPEYRITPEMFRGLIEMPRIRAFKDSVLDEIVFAAFLEAVRSNNADFRLICGDESKFVPSLLAGAAGVIGQGCSAYPEILAAAETQIINGNQEPALTAQSDIGLALTAMDGLDGSIATKQYLIRKGLKIQPYDRNGANGYSKEIIDRVERSLDAIRAPYLN